MVFSLKEFLFRKISRKLLLGFLFTGLVPLIVLGILITGIVRSHLISEAGESFRAIAMFNVEKAESYISSLKSKSAEFSNDDFIRGKIREGKAGELSRYLRDKIAQDESILGSFIINPNGTIIAATDEEEIGKDESSDDYFVKGKKGAYITNLIGHEHFRSAGQIVVSAPIAEGGRILGVAVNSFSTLELGEQLSGKLPKNAEIYFVDRKKVMFTHPYPSVHMPGMVVDTLPVKNCLERNEDASGIWKNYEGKDVIGSSKCFPDAGWSLLIEAKTEDAFSVLNKIYFYFIVSGGILLVFVIITGLILTRRISRPITEMHHATEEIGKRNFSVKVDIKTGDELEQLGETINETAKVLERFDEEHRQLESAKTRFLSITSHELRSPMTPMKAQLQMLEQGYFGGMPEKQKEALGIVIKNADRLDSIIADFLEVSRIEAARLKFSFRKANLADTVKDIAGLMKGFMPEKEIGIVTNIAKLPAIECDPDRVSQVLRNLINNAIKFSPPGKTVDVSAKVSGNYLLFTVRDHGIGISEENLRRIFEPFFQAEQTIYRKAGGTGLGLAICRGIVEAQSGRIWAESRLGKGTSFQFTVPLKPVREIRPIKLLFSAAEDVERKLKAVFRDFLGPVGEIEFERLRRERGMSREGFLQYVNSLSKDGIIQSQIEAPFVESIMLAMGGKSKEDMVRELLIEFVGPIGERKFQEIGANREKILKMIADFEKRRIMKSSEAGRFREELAKILEVGRHGIEARRRKLIQKLVKSVAELYGPIAVQKANALKTLKVDEKGRIRKIEGDTKEILDELRRSYLDLAGDLKRFIKEKELREVLEV